MLWRDLGLSRPAMAYRHSSLRGVLLRRCRKSSPRPLDFLCPLRELGAALVAAAPALASNLKAGRSRGYRLARRIHRRTPAPRHTSVRAGSRTKPHTSLLRPGKPAASNPAAIGRGQLDFGGET